MKSYFSHDANARNSDKLLRVRIKYRAEGYGIYFMLLERLRDEPDYTSVKDYNTIAFDLRCDSAVLKSIVEDFGLFSFTEDDRFYSESLIRRMKKIEEVSDIKRRAANARWDTMRMNKNNDTNVMHMHNDSDAIKLNNIKSNISLRENKSDDVLSTDITEQEREKIFNIFFFRNMINPGRELTRFISHYQSQGWKKKNGMQITDKVLTAMSWEPETKQVAFPPVFMSFLSEVFQLTQDRKLLSINAVSIDSERIRIKCNNDVINVFEGNSNVVKPLYNKYFPGIRLEYSIKNKGATGA